MPGVSSGGGQSPGGTMEVPRLTVVCHERRPPTDDTFAYCTPDSAAHVKPGHAASAARPWKADGYPDRATGTDANVG